LQCLASVGIEKLSMQANKLMPLEDITGKTMQQVAWEAALTLEGSERFVRLVLICLGVIYLSLSFYLMPFGKCYLDCTLSLGTGKLYCSMNRWLNKKCLVGKRELEGGQRNPGLITLVLAQ
jgi:hypothetical protein